MNNNDMIPVDPKWGEEPNELLDVLKLLLDYDTKNGIIQSPYMFRGCCSSEYDLKSVLQREYDCLDYRGIALKERILLRNFKKYARGFFEYRGLLEWEWLALARHHGLPTRLLDWTGSPFVALYFATRPSESKRIESDGIIWRLNQDKLNTLCSDSRLANHRSENNTRSFTPWDLEEVGIRNLEELDNSRNDAIWAIHFEPPAIDQRIVNQQATFTLMNDPTKNLRDWLLTQMKESQEMRSSPELLSAIRIKAQYRRTIFKRLHQMNITPRVLFPGLQGIAQTLQDRYSVR